MLKNAEGFQILLHDVLETVGSLTAKFNSVHSCRNLVTTVKLACLSSLTTVTVH